MVNESPDIVEYREAIRAGRRGPFLYASLLGIRAHNYLTIVKILKKGLEYRSFERFQRNTRLSTSELIGAVTIPLRTLHRRKGTGRLGPDESDRVVRFSRVFGRALELFEGDADAARSWLSKPLRALGGESPLVLARTDLGTREVEALIDRLEHGVIN